MNLAPKPPAGLPPRIWLVVEPNGNRHFIEREFLGGIDAWAQGTKVTVVEYRFAEVVHRPPPPLKKKP